VCITINKPHTKSDPNPNPNPTTAIFISQKGKVSIKAGFLQKNAHTN